MQSLAAKYMFTHIFGSFFVRFKKIKTSKYGFELFTNESLFTYYIVTNYPGKYS